MAETIDCRPGCGACCVVPGISSPIPGMPGGKPPFTRCAQLSESNRCLLFGSNLRPEVCTRLAPSVEMCGASDGEAFAILRWMEHSTRPDEKMRG